MEMFRIYEEKASEADNLIAAIKKQFREQLEAIQAKNRELKAQMKKPKKQTGEEMEDERKIRAEKNNHDCVEGSSESKIYKRQSLEGIMR